MKSKLFKLFSFLLVLTFVLAACGTGSSNNPKVETQQEKIARLTPLIEKLKLGMRPFALTYSTAVHLEEGISGQGKVVWEKYNSFLTSAGEQSRTIKSCFPMTQDFVVGAASAVFGDDGKGHPTTPGDEAKAIVQQLAVNVNALSVDSLYAGDVAECQKQLTDFVAWARVERKEYLHEREILADKLTGYDEWRRNSYTDVMVNTFVSQYGPYVTQIITELGDDGTTMINNIATSAGTDAVALPLTGNQLDFLGLPTGALWYVTNDKAPCNAALAIYNADLTDPAEKKWAMEQTGGLPVEMYKAKWSSVANTCTLYRQAAWEMLMKPIFSLEANVRQACGVDAGFDQEIDPETCRPVEPQPQP